jgi:hypothetical protein
MSGSILASGFIYEDPKSIELVEKLKQRTREGRLIWRKTSTSYETVLRNKTVVGFIVASTTLIFLQQKGWAQFSVRQRDGNEVLTVQNPASVFGEISRSALVKSVDELFAIVSEKGSARICDVLDELDKT